MVILRISDVLKRLGCGRTQLYASLANGLVTRQVRLSGRAVGWPLDEIDAIATARAGGATVAQLQKLVKKLEHRRAKNWRELQLNLGLKAIEARHDGREASPNRGRRA